MADTFSQIHLQFVFVVKHRKELINEAIRPRLEKYLTGITTGLNCKMLAIYCNPDHTHILVGIPPNLAPSDLARKLKAGSSKFLNQEFHLPAPFRWQAGYGVFSYTKSQIDRVVKYILNQPTHHAEKPLETEYPEMLHNAGIETAGKLIFD